MAMLPKIPCTVQGTKIKPHFDLGMQSRKVAFNAPFSLKKRREKKHTSKS